MTAKSARVRVDRLGYEVVRQLAGLGHTVIFGARDPENGEAAARSTMG
jgi:NAD(P)-dependent dehydrogenase (short-subunit alcohol dehydrogenase family)